jgi:hypothetical protein
MKAKKGKADLLGDLKTIMDAVHKDDKELAGYMGQVKEQVSRAGAGVCVNKRGAG